MPAWISNPYDTAGDAVLKDWRVLLTYRGSKHFVGLCMRTGPYRVSPPITSYIREARTGVTEKGLRFVLSRPPGRDTGLWRLVWLIARWDNKVSGAKDITSEYVEY